MPKLTPRGMADIIVDHLHGLAAADVAKAMKEVVALLASLGLLTKWRDIEREIHGSWKRKFGVSNVTVVSAHPLSKAARLHLEEVAHGADIVERVDERLMAGAIVRIDDRRIDGSMAGRLARLKQQLISN